MSGPRPLLVMSGLPGSGKTTLGRSLAHALDLPLLDKDEILEGLFDSLGIGDAEWRNRLSRAADEVLRRLALQSRGAVLASFWRHPQSAGESGTPTGWLNALPRPIIEVCCVCPPATAAERFLARQRHGGHLDSQKRPEEVVAGFRQLQDLGDLGVGALIRVDTSAAVDVETVVSTLRARLGRPLADMRDFSIMASESEKARRPTGPEARVRLLRDTAFELVRGNSSNNPGAALMRQELARRFPDVSSDEYAQVYFDLFDECLKLLDEARELAAMHWEERLSEVEALRQLGERFPGFSADTYQSALDNWRQAFR